MLVLHGPSKSIQELKAIPIPETRRWNKEGEGVGNWKPVNHGDLVETLLRAVADKGLEVKASEWEVNEGGTDLFGALQIGRGTPAEAPEGTEMAIGLRHSNAGRHAVTLAFGAKVFVCSNGVFFGSTVVQRRHTLKLDLEGAFEVAIQEYLDSTAGVRDWICALQGIELEKHEPDRVMIESGRRGVIPWSFLRHVEENWRTPKHKEFKPRTAWSLYNAYTEAAKARGLDGQLETLAALERLFLPIILERRGRAARAAVIAPYPDGQDAGF